MADEVNHEAFEGQLRDMAVSWDTNQFELPEEVRSAIEHHCTIVVEHATKMNMAAILNFNTPWAHIPPTKNGPYIAEACFASMMLAGRLPLPEAELIVPDTIGDSD